MLSEEEELRLALEESLREANNPAFRPQQGARKEVTTDDDEVARAIALSLQEGDKPVPMKVEVHRSPSTVADEQLDMAIALSLQEQLNLEALPLPETNHKDANNSSFSLHVQDMWKNSSFNNFWESLFRSTNNSGGNNPPAPAADNSNPKSKGTTPGIKSKEKLNVYECNRCQKPCSSLFNRYEFQGKYYHMDCFRCGGCDQIMSAGPCSVKDSVPFHRECLVMLLAPTCSVCSTSITDRYYSHPFFTECKYCIEHETTQRSCFSCRKREPLRSSGRGPYVELHDGRALCQECVSTVVMETAEMKVLYAAILQYFEEVLMLPIPAAMREVPVLAVDIGTLNQSLEQENSASNSGKHNHTGQCNEEAIKGNGSCTLGLTMSTVGQVRHIDGASLLNGRWALQPSFFHMEEVRKVTCILVLYGLPHDQSAAVLAHEAMHAWLRLRRDVPTTLPSKIEEGLCQLISYKYLEFLSERALLCTESAIIAGRSAMKLQEKKQEEKFRQYCRYCIETDRGEIYGDGYRDAAKAASELPLEDLLDFVAQHQRFPEV